MTIDLDRFLQAQDGPAGFAQALAELQAGAKRSHWIWYIFPQLAGLGSSAMAEAYGLRGVEEATAYLTHPILRERLLAVMLAVRAQPVPLRVLMGSQVDVMKLVSSMTLFQEIGRRTGDAEVAAAAGEILARAAEVGMGECAFTAAQLRASRE